MHHILHTRGIIAQLGEHLPYKQRVTGSSPVGPTKSKDLCRRGGTGRRTGLKILRGLPPVPVRFRSPALWFGSEPSKIDEKCTDEYLYSDVHFLLILFAGYAPSKEMRSIFEMVF